MPEGHTIHRVARDHGRWFAGERLAAASPQGRFAAEARRLDGRELRSVEACGKHLFYEWDGGLVVHVHLGLYGKFRTHTAPPPEPRGQVRWRAVGQSRAFDLHGPNRCELVTAAERQRHLDRLGPDPLRADADPERAWRRIARSRAPIGALLLNQEVIAGVGNVYRAEALHLLGIHPERAGRELSRAEFDALWARLVELLTIGVRYNRIIVADPDEVGKPRSRMRRDERLRIYKRPACPACAGPVGVWTCGARTVYACEACQT